MCCVPDEVYVATWAVPVAIDRPNAIERPTIEALVPPAMGAGFGNVSYDEVVKQMTAVYEAVSV